MTAATFEEQEGDIPHHKLLKEVSMVLEIVLNGGKSGQRVTRRYEVESLDDIPIEEIKEVFPTRMVWLITDEPNVVPYLRSQGFRFLGVQLISPP